jgi:hypothetical protein
MCFTESTKRRSVGEGNFSSPERQEIPLEEGDVVGLNVIPSTSDRDAPVLVSYTSGHAWLVAHDLSRKDSLNSLDSDPSALEVEYSTTLDTASSRKGMLRNREDVLVQLDHISPAPTLLCHIGRTPGGRILRLYAISAHALSQLQSQKPGLQLLLEYTMPQQRGQTQSTAKYDIHAGSGTLYQLLDSRLSVYDLSGTTPNHITQLGSKTRPISGFVRLSSSMVMTVSHGEASLYETNFGSLFAFTTLPSSNTPSSKKRKRNKEDEKEQDHSTTLEQLHCFSNAGPVVALREHDLATLQVNDSLGKTKRARLRGPRMADVVFKNSNHVGGEALPKKKHRQQWREWTAQVDDLIATDNVEGLEKLVASDKRLGRQRSVTYSPEEALVEDEEVDGDAYHDLWPLPEPVDRSQLDELRTMYVLSRIFRYSEGRLEVAIPSLKLLEWFSLAGCLTTSYIRRSWDLYDHAAHDGEILRLGDVMSALRVLDDDFQLIHDFLSLPVSWPIEDVVQALRFVVQSFDELTPTAELPLLLPPVPASEQPNGEAHMTNGFDVDLEVELETKVAEEELEQAAALLSGGLEVRSDTLRVIFARLLDFDSGHVITTLRTMMSHDELVFFIHVLRIELADGGWTSRYVDIAQAEDEGEEQGWVNAKGGVEEVGPNNQAIKTIGDLLSCAVDAIGVNGWLVGHSTSAPATAKELLTSLRAEVCAGLEGCYEADTLGMALGEIERLAAPAGKSLLPRLSHDLAAGGGTGTILPMGGNAMVNAVEQRKGAASKKSRLARAEERKRIGSYSFERIRI